MTTIWQRRPTPTDLQAMARDTAIEHLGIEFMEVGDDWITARMSGVSVWPPCLTSCQVTAPAPGRVIASYGTAQFPTTGFHVESGL